MRIVGAYHTAGQHGGQLKEPFHTPELEKVKATDAKELLRQTEDPVKAGNQARFRGFLVVRAGCLHHEKRRYAIPESALE